MTATPQMRQAEKSGLRKAAMLLIALGPELSAQLLKNFRDDEIERLTSEVVRIGQISAEEREAILEEFYHTAMMQEYASQGGIAYAQEMLERAVGPQRAKELVQRLIENARSLPFSFIRELEPAQLVTFLRSEHPQTIALVLSFAGPEKAGAVIASLPPTLQAEVAVRIATMERTNADVLADVEQLMRERLSAVLQQTKKKDVAQQSGGVDHLVKVLKEVDRGTEKTIIDSLESVEPRLADDIKKRMFVFENITMLDDRSIQRVLREVDFKDLSLAMRGSSEEVKQRIFSNMSERAVGMLQEDMAVQGPVRLRNVEEAQSRIVNTIRRLEDAEEIIIARGGEDDILL